MAAFAGVHPSEVLLARSPVDNANPHPALRESQALTLAEHLLRLRGVFRSGPAESSVLPTTLVALALLSLGLVFAQAAPFTEATVTRLQNRVSYGVTTDPDKARPANPQDVVRANNFLLTESDARAELKYPDGSIVRIGQNTVFSFEADTRTLALRKGTFIFYVPKGQGGATIRTPSLTAAITGTVGKVSGNTIAILEGSVKLIPSGRVVGPGQFARANPDGTITIDFFDKAKANDGVLMTFNGALPPFEEQLLTANTRLQIPRISDTLERTQNLPSTIEKFNPKVDPPSNNPPAPVIRPPATRVVVPPPRQRPPGSNTQY
jgi:hypothetical protein